jgi:flagellar basal-body rod protein FlgB
MDMLNKLGQYFDGQQAALELRAYRLQLIAANIANADTPNYKAVDFNFTEALKKARGDSQSFKKAIPPSPVKIARTDPRHYAGLPAESRAVVSALGLGGKATGASTQAKVQYRQAMQRSIDGNTVDMDVERTAFAENVAQYQAILGLMSKRTNSLTETIRGDR